MTTYFKRCKMHENLGKPIFCPKDKKRISPQIEQCIGKCSGLCKFIWKTSNCYLYIMLYHAVIQILGHQFLCNCMLVCKLCSGGFKTIGQVKGTCTSIHVIQDMHIYNIKHLKYSFINTVIITNAFMIIYTCFIIIIWVNTQTNERTNAY